MMESSDVVQLMKMEYAEMPELKLTFRQAQRLWNLPSESCERALECSDRREIPVRDCRRCVRSASRPSRRVGPIRSALRAMWAR